MSLWGLENGTDEYKAARKEVDLRAAKRILQVCQAHGGCFTKAGQYLSSLVRTCVQFACFVRLCGRDSAR